MSQENSGLPANSGAPSQGFEDPRISIEDFSRIQMRVGQIVEAEKIAGSRKLVKLKVDIGGEVRQVVAGIGDAYDAATLLNRKVVVVVNLKPARLMGVESNGMIVAAAVDGRPVLATFTEEVPNGSLLK
jgi:methionine--tRNA ligase beta chain